MMEFGDIIKEDVIEIDGLIGNLVPRCFEGWLDDNFGGSRWSYDVGACDEAIAKPIWDLLERGGKRWRPFLMKLSYLAVGGTGNIDKFLPLPEVIHNGTLMIDDIEDNSDFRRGRACIHKIYGNDIAINAGNAMYYLPLLSVAKSDLGLEKKVKVYELINEEMIKLHFGQGMDIFWHGGNKIPSEDEYLQMCAFKTGTLARMAAKLGAILGGADEEVIDALGVFAEAVGVAFQIQDDILNVLPPLGWGKDYGDDISEGKRTLLIIKTLERVNDINGEKLIGILDANTKDKVIIDEAIKMLRDSGSIEYAIGVARNLVINAWLSLDSVLSESDAKNKLRLLSEFVVSREI